MAINNLQYIQHTLNAKTITINPLVTSSTFLQMGKILEAAYNRVIFSKKN